MPYDLRQDFLLGPLPTEDGGKRLGPVILRSKIGQGGMGIVYAGDHLERGHTVAVKCLFTSWADQDPSYVKRFQREVRIAEALSHPHMVEVHEAGESHGIHYLVMELLKGLTLGKTVRRGGPLSAIHAVPIIRDVAAALAAAHASEIVHRDVKPDNVFITESGTAKLMDLGLAKASRAIDSFATGSGVVLGSLPFMPPEQHRSLAEVGPAGDVFSLGTTLWYALTGAHPPRDQRLPDLPAGVADRNLTTIISRATEPEAARRHDHAGDLAAALDIWLSEAPRIDAGPGLAARVAAQANAAMQAAADDSDDFLESFPSGSPSGEPRLPSRPPPLPPGAIPPPSSAGSS